MACRQQAQIESQHQLLAAKEQRLRYLKEQEARQQRVQAESERLKRLRERVDAQELKLRKLRALRGQVDHQKQNNISLSKYPVFYLQKVNLVYDPFQCVLSCWVVFEEDVGVLEDYSFLSGSEASFLEVAQYIIVG